MTNKKIIDKRIILFFCIALVLRFLLMPIASHSDIILINVFPNLLLKYGIIDIYSYVNKNVKLPGFQYYSPITYYSFAFFQFLYQLITPSFSDWMNNLLNPVSNNIFPKDYQYFTQVHNPHIFKDLFLAKTPYLLFDVASVFVLIKFVKAQILSKGAILVWVFNPILIYSTYVFGQYDVIPSFFILLGFYFLRKNPVFGVFWLGIAMAYKTYPILCIIPPQIPRSIGSLFLFLKHNQGGI